MLNCSSRKSWLVLTVVLVTGLGMGRAQAASPAPAAPGAQQAAPAGENSGIAGTWQGTLHAGRDLRLVAKLSMDAGTLKATMYSIDQGGQAIPASAASFADGTLKFAIAMIDGKYEGKMSPDGKSIAGTWTQAGNPMPLVLERTTPATEWAIPEPPPRIPPMAADAHPSFEVATIKPTAPGEQRTFLIWRGTEMNVVNFSLSSLIKFAYDVQDKQILGAPEWLSTEKWDIQAKPDTPGQPNGEQLKEMVQKLLADRFALKFHKDQKEMSAYVLTVGKDGPKMTKNTDNPNGLPGLFFGPIGTLHVMNATIQNFTNLMQSTVLDRPVVDKTGLDGRWNFTLKWTPDESQFSGMGIKIPPPADNTSADPPLFTAIQEQLDMKLEAQRTQVPVLAIDHVDHPSAN